MKSLYFTAAVLLFCTFSTSSQTTIALQPDTYFGNDAMVDELNPDLNLGETPEFNAEGWTVQGLSTKHRSLLAFEMDAIPEGAIILNATLTLYNNPTCSNGFQNGEHSSYSGSNASVIQRVTEDWNDQLVIWNNQPATTNQNQVNLPESTDPHQNYSLDVTQLVVDMLADPANSFGFMLKLLNEDHLSTPRFLFK